MKNKYYIQCVVCGGSGNESELLECAACEGRGYFLTIEGNELFALLERLGLLKE